MRKVIGAIALGMTLTACSSGTPTPTSTSAPTTSSASAQTPTPAATSTAAVSSTGPTTLTSPTTPPTTSASPSATSAKRTQHALRAIQTAETAAKGKAIELHWDVNRWEVAVIDGTTRRQLDVSADGQRVLRTQTGVAETDHDNRLPSVRHDLAYAVKTATAAAAGDIDEVHLETRHGTVVWESSIHKAGAGSTHVYVDAVSGKIVS